MVGSQSASWASAPLTWMSSLGGRRLGRRRVAGRAGAGEVGGWGGAGASQGQSYVWADGPQRVARRQPG